NFPLKIPVLIFVFACFVAVAGAMEFLESYKSLKRLLEILIFFWAVNCIDSQDLRERLTILLIASAALSTFTGFYNSWENGITHVHRAEGTMSVYMTYAGLLMLALLVAAGKLIFFPKENKWIYIAFVMLSACLLLSYTRQAWLGAIAGIIFLIWFRKKSLLWFLPIVLAVIFAISPNAIKFRINSLTDLKDVNLQRRMALWQGGWLVFMDHPLTGCGFKCIDALNQNYPDPTGIIGKLRGMHNNFLQLAVDTGLFGLIAWISIWVTYFMTLYQRLIVNSGDLVYKKDAMGSAAAVLGFLVAGFFETNFYDSEVSMLLYFIMALPFAANSKKTISN
ncbi:MAG: O-antigen ligase family protein, partial [Nitrospinota bacterium]|nr:O-antigen ligase family protein [Nitrospinota bacterium]